MALEALGVVDLPAEDEWAADDLDPEDFEPADDEWPAPGADFLLAAWDLDADALFEEDLDFFEALPAL